MKILHLDDYFHPDAGYQLNILAKYMVQQGHEVTIITGEMEKFPEEINAFFGKDNMDERDRAYENAYGVKIIRLPLLAFISGRALFAPGLMKTVMECKPDVIYAHSNDTLLGMWATWNHKKFGCPLVMDNHMLEMASENPMRNLFRVVYRAIFTPIIRKNHFIVIRPQDDPYVEKCLGIPLSQAPFISFGSDTLLFHPDGAVKAAFRKEHGISEDAFVVVYAGKLDEPKGGKLLSELTVMPLHTDREVVYVVVGNTAGDYGREVEETFARSPYRVLRFPTQKYADLAPYFQCADLAVFPRQCSLSFYDAQACGLPVLSEDNNINVDRCAHQNGWNFKADDVEDFHAMLERVVNLPAGEFAAVSANALAFIQRDYDYAAKAKEYEQILLNERKTYRK